MRPRVLAVVFAAFGLGMGVGLFLFEACGQTSSVAVRFAGAPPAEGAIRVYVSGAVRQPGVYPLRTGDRIVEAVEAAGGPAGDADTEAVNFAERVQDEEHLRVPRVGEPAGAQMVSTATRTGASVLQRIDINRADANLLRSLPGIGTARAESIVASREKDGPFKSTDELLQRKLLSQSVYTQVKDLIDVAP